MNSTPLKILLVEDSPSDAALLQESLTQGDFGQFAFTHATSLAEGLSHARKDRFDALLLDLTLPDSAGRETFLRMRAEVPLLPIVVLTSIEDETLSLEALRHGIQDYLIKGQVYGRQTARAIGYAIERKQTEEALKRAEAALQAERDQLEKRVRERTTELSEANRALHAEMAQRQRAEKAHHEVLRQLSHAQETERGRISRELHDRLGQELTALKLGLQAVRKKCAAAICEPETLGNLSQLTDSLMRDIHRLAWELRPSVLDDLGLELALRRYTTEWSENSGVPVDFHSTGVETHRLPADLETAFYRVTQEALTNVTRHANAQRVSVLLERRPTQVSLIVEDDGAGFDPAAAGHSPGAQGRLGLLGMRERVTLAGGMFDIESTPGTGTTVFVRVPLEARPVQS